MTTVRSRGLAVLLVASLAAGVKPASSQQSGPVVVVETSAGAFAFETFPDEAPKTVAHILELVKAGFYDGQRFHRAIPGFVVQWGDPQTRNLEKSADWGRGDAADSQIYVTLANRPDLNGRYTVFGRLIAGADVPDRIQKDDLITRMYVR